MDKPLKNPEAEQCAQDIAKVIHDKIARQAVFQKFSDSRPGLKNWEGLAIGQRATWVAKQAALASLDTK